MGLDMYLHKRVYVGAKWDHRKVTGRVSIKEGDKKLPIRFKRISEIIEEVGYWRKANAIHKWFVENVQKGTDDCGEYHVEDEQLEDLLELCKEVMAKAKLVPGTLHTGTQYSGGKTTELFEEGKVIENAEEIEKLLPTGGGFFFGSTDYNEWYLSDVQNTIDMIEPLLKELKDEQKNGIYSSVYYSSSW